MVDVGCSDAGKIGDGIGRGEGSRGRRPYPISSRIAAPLIGSITPITPIPGRTPTSIALAISDNAGGDEVDAGNDESTPPAPPSPVEAAAAAAAAAAAEVAADTAAESAAEAIALVANAELPVFLGGLSPI